MTEVTVLGGDCHRVDGDVGEVERLILDAARGAIMQFAWLTDAQTAQRVGFNPDHVVTLRAVGATGEPAAPTT